MPSGTTKFFTILATGCSISGVGVGMLLTGWHPKIGIALMITGYVYLLYELLTCEVVVKHVPEGMLRFMAGVMLAAFTLLIVGPDIERTLIVHLPSHPPAEGDSGKTSGPPKPTQAISESHVEPRIRETPVALHPYDLSGRRGEVLSAILDTQTEPRDTIRVGCISYMEDSCIAAGRFLLLFSQAGWKIDSNRVFRFDPGIPPEGMTIASKTPRYTDNLPPHLGHWSAMDASQITFWRAFRWMQIPLGASGDPDMPDGTIGIYFGPEPKNVNVRSALQAKRDLAQLFVYELVQVQATEGHCSTDAEKCKVKRLEWTKTVSTFLKYCDCNLNKSWIKRWQAASEGPDGKADVIMRREEKCLADIVSYLNQSKS